VFSQPRARVVGRSVLPLSIALLSACGDPPTTIARSPSAAVSRDLLAAAVVTVTNTDDSGPGSLRQAITDAPDSSTIRFDASIAGQTIVVTSGFMPIAKSLTIEGPLPAGITISGNLSSRVFRVEQNTTVVLRNLSIVNGRFVSGAGVLNQGALTLDHVLLANNETTGDGGGLAAIGAATQTTILNSTISGNVARRGGGIAVDRPVIIRNTTIAENTAGDGGGMFVVGGTVSVRNSIIANNVDNDPTNAVTANCGKNVDVPVFLGTNLSSDDSCGTEPNIFIGNPMLGPLANNGGPTKTQALSVGSPAIDGGTACTEPTDQRYVARPQGVTCDIGAFELDRFATVTLAIDPNVALDANTGRAIVTGTATCSEPAIVGIDVALSQTQKVAGKFNTIIQANATTNMRCVGTSAWSVTLTPSTGTFEKGAATGTAQTGSTLGFLPAKVTSTVKAFAVK